MKNKSQLSGLGFGIVVFLFLFMIGMMNVNFIKTEVTNARTGMSCSDATISDGSKLTCLVIDFVLPYFMIIVISAAGGFLVAKFMM